MTEMPSTPLILRCGEARLEGGLQGSQGVLDASFEVR